MSKFVCDIETDGLLKELTKVHSMVLVDLKTRAIFSFADQPGHTPLADGLRMMDEAELLVFHNGIKFDLPALEKVFGWAPTGTAWDSLVLSRLVYPDIEQDDFRLIKKSPGAIPGNLIGGHSVAAWGYRLKLRKGDFKDKWDHWSPRMHEYMIQDGKVQWKITTHLLDQIQKRKISDQAIEVEHKFAELMFLQQEYGVRFDVERAQELYATLSARRAELANELRRIFKPWLGRDGQAVEPKKPRRYFIEHPLGQTERVHSKHGLQRGYWNHVEGTHQKIKMVEFNPASHDHIAQRLIYIHGWKPSEFTKKGKPQVTAEIMGKLIYPEAPTLALYLMINKRIGALAEGDQAWLKVVTPEGRIHGTVISIGAPTHRCSHHHPNITQVPKVREKKINGKKVILKGEAGGYGFECRDLFVVDKEKHIQMMLVGADASGLELRMMGHYMAKFDGGSFAKELLEGDPHDKNAAILGELAPNRDAAKTETYAVIYGGGDAKLGRTAFEYSLKLGIPLKGSLISLGKRVRAGLMKGMPGLEKLIKAVQARAKRRGYLVAIDRRQVPVRSPHAALNFLFQSAGAIVMKYALVRFAAEMEKRGYQHGVEWRLAINAHDEIQANVKSEIAKETGELAVASIKWAGEHLRLRIPLDGEYKIGHSWAATH